MQEGVCALSHISPLERLFMSNTVMFPADNGGSKYCGGFSETATLQSFLPVRHVRTVGHFLTESAHVHYW